MSTSVNDFKMPTGFQGRPPSWVTDGDTFISSDKKTTLFEVAHHQQPWQSHKALFIIHGFGEHALRYSHFAHELQNTVGAVSSYDQKGHGRSEGLRGHLGQFSELVDDAEIALRRLDQKLKARFQKSEIHLFAHSMGGHVGIRLLGTKKDLPLQSATISAPFLGTKQAVPMVKKMAAKAFFYLWDDLQLPTGLDATLISRDPEVVKAYLADRLVHSKMTSKMWDSMQTAMQDTQEKIREFKVPTFFVLPLADGIVDEKKAMQFYEKLKAPVKDVLTLPEYFHESFNDLQREKVFEALRKWIQKNAHA